MIRKICVVLTDRANYGRLLPVMKAIHSSPQLQLQTVCTGTMVLERFGNVAEIVRSEGFSIDSKVHIEIEGSTPATMAKSIGFGIIELASEFQRLSPDIVLIIGDRYEALAATIAASYQNITVAHVQGGEISGSIDESTRHAITKLSHYHFPATKKSYEHIIMMGEEPSNVFNVGCPCGDYILGLDDTIPAEAFTTGIGAHISAEDQYLLVILHPVTTDYGKEDEQTIAALNALNKISLKTLWLWPNIDAGSDRISKQLRKFREINGDKWLRLVKNLEPTTFQKILKNALCAIGNSSSFIRDSTFTGTPVVLIGNRQNGRETGLNTISVTANEHAIYEAILSQLDHGRYAPSKLYGDGQAARRIVSKLETVSLYCQKTLHYQKNQ